MSRMLGIFLLYSNVFAYEILSLHFYQEEDVSVVELNFDEEGFVLNKFQLIDDRQIILDIKDTTASEKVMRSFDASEFPGSVVYVSPYKKPNSPNDMRVAIQLRDNVRSLVSALGTKLTLKIENRFGVFNQNLLERGKKKESLLGSGVGDKKIRVPKGGNVEDILDNLTYQGPKRYIGKRISINVVGISVTEVLKMIADSSGFNLITKKGVSSLPPLTLSLTNIPWDQALDTILKLAKLDASKNGNILMVQTLSKAREERSVEQQMKEQLQVQEPLVTKIFPISYADTGSLMAILMDYLTGGRGTVKVDERTNSLIVKDTIKTMDRVRKIIEALDTQTPQILIEARIVETSEKYAKELGLRRGISFGYDPITPPPLGTDHVGPGFSFSTAPESGEQGRGFFGFTLSKYHRLLNLSLELQLMESESKGKVISSPRVIAENNTEASITSTDTTSFKTSVSNDGVTEEKFEKISATLNLKVTPHVTNEGSIHMKIALTRGSFGAKPSPSAPPDITNRAINTNVLVDNGSTVVLGGLYTFSEDNTHSGLPFLKDIPLLGWLFRTAYSPSHGKSELIIFMTPRIVNQEEAGLTDGKEVI